MSESFSLDRVYAYTVKPQKTVEDADREEPDGGVIAIDDKLQALLNDAFKRLNSRELSSVVFEGFTGGAERVHPVRDELLTIAFGTTTAPRAAAARLAGRLSIVSDERSRSSLFVVVVQRGVGEVRRVTLFAFPREDVIQLRSNRKGAGEEQVLQAVENAFGAGSQLRKVARASGVNTKTQFLEADIFDYQHAKGAPDRSAAEFWVKNFLLAKYRIDSQTGTKILSAALRRALQASPPEQRDAVFGTMHKLGSGQTLQTSLQLIAETDIPPDLQEAFLHGVPAQVATAKFDISVSTIKEGLGRRVIITNDGIVVTAPTELNGTSLEVVTEKNGARRVSMNSSVKEEHVKQETKRGRKRAASAGGEGQ